jgi:EAL domain-containing protein (putative c-di-GMP-specific phosphodiesterase class I)
MTPFSPSVLMLLGAAALSWFLSVSVVGEGIENEATSRLLRGYGCDLGQGFYLGRPESLHAASRRLEAEPDRVAASAPGHLA